MSASVSQLASRSPTAQAADAAYAETLGKYELVYEDFQLAGQTFEMVHPRSTDELLDEQEFNRDGRIPYWAELWPSARVLADQLALLSASGRCLLELGCGAGLCAVAASLVGFRVTATDYYSEALEFVRLNAKRNALPIPAVRMVDWRALPADLGQFDLVIAADVLYEPPYTALVAQVISQTLRRGGQAIVADPGRCHAAGFAEVCQEVGLRQCEHRQIVYPSQPKEVTVDVRFFDRL